MRFLAVRFEGLRHDGNKTDIVKYRDVGSIKAETLPPLESSGEFSYTLFRNEKRLDAAYKRLFSRPEMVASLLAEMDFSTLMPLPTGHIPNGQLSPCFPAMFSPAWKWAAG